MSSHHFEHVALIGLGLIGSSLAHAMHRGGLAGKISGYARSPETRDRAMALGLVDTVHANAAEAVRGADLVIVCAPVGAFAAIGEEIGPAIAQGCIVTDVGSVKEPVFEALAPCLADGVSLIPGHPIAGTEQSGPDSGFAELFDGRWCILTPPDDVDEDAYERLANLWRACGSMVERMDAAHHDRVLAITSHLPHLIAYNIVGTAAELEEVTQSEVIKFSASGFRDFTRLAASDPTMWRDVFLANKDAVLEMLGCFTEDLQALQKIIRKGDGEALFNHFTNTRAIRRSIVDAGQDTALPNFGRMAATQAGAGEEEE